MQTVVMDAQQHIPSSSIKTAWLQADRGQIKVISFGYNLLRTPVQNV